MEGGKEGGRDDVKNDLINPMKDDTNWHKSKPFIPTYQNELDNFLYDSSLQSTEECYDTECCSHQMM